MKTASPTLPHPLATPAEPAAAMSAHQRIGFELGWDYARYRSQPPAPYLAEPSSLRDGLAAGQAVFGDRTLVPGRWVRQWLQLRLTAWLRGRSIELLQVTPHTLQQLDVSHCPITRQPLTGALREGGAASIDRVRNDAGYAAGNLVAMSALANRAKGALGRREALQRACDAARPGRIDGLSTAEWQRVAVLCSFVEALPHAEACAVPLLLLPPNRLRLFNPVQALQTFVSRQMLTPGWSGRIRRFEALLAGQPLRRAFQSFFYAFLPRVLEAGRDLDPLHSRWAVENAWAHPLVLRRWSDFACQLDAAGCERLLLRAQGKRLGDRRIDTYDEAQATEGWNLASRGYVPAVAAEPALPVQEELAL